MGHKILLENKASFTLVEVLVTAFVAVLVFLAVWSIYIMGWTWWYEVSPRIEAQRIARLAVAKIIDGVPDPTAGYDLIGSARYDRRNGIAASYYYLPDLPNAQADSDGKLFSREIDFGLFEDYKTYSPTAKRNIRSFYLGTDPNTGLNVVYYKDGNAALHKIDATLGISDLKFYYNQWIDGFGATHTDIITTATVEKDTVRTGLEPYHIKVEYSGYTSLRNAQ